MPAPSLPAPGAPRRALLSPLTRRVLAVNLLALVILVAGLLYLDAYEDGLIDAELQALRTQGEIVAAALGEGAVETAAGAQQRLQEDKARQMLRRLVEPTSTRARLFAVSGALAADSRSLSGPGGAVQVMELPPPREEGAVAGMLLDVYDRLVSWLPGRQPAEPYREAPDQRAEDYREVTQALVGEAASAVRAGPEGSLVLSYAVPVQRYKQVVGALLLSTGSKEIDASVRAVRLDIVKVFGIALAVTILLSLYLASTIARPIRRLAVAAEQVRRTHGRQHRIPDFSGRRDEVGELAAALRDMTDALWARMDAIERFAADVAHEIKNPLTSLRSAVETAARLRDPDQQKRLMTVIQDDVERLDRLISDISEASRLDAELSRAEAAPVDLYRMLRTLVDLHAATAKPGAPRLELHGDEGDAIEVAGLEVRLGQVFRNLIANAISFSPPGGVIRIAVAREGGFVAVTVEDEGPGLPEAKLEAIFERFYSERPTVEKFGLHSGLGLSISKQIVEAHDGIIRAENRRTESGEMAGARFVVLLPRI